MTGPYEQPPTAGAAAVVRYVSDWYDDHDGELEDDNAELLAAVEQALEPGEQLLCVVPVVKVSPTLDVLVVTDRRVCAGFGDDLVKSGYKICVPVADLTQIEVGGWVMDNVRLVKGDGSGEKVGSLRDGSDVGPLQRAFAAARSGAPAAPAAATESAPAAPTGPTTYEVYRPGANDPEALR